MNDLALPIAALGPFDWVLNALGFAVLMTVFILFRSAMVRRRRRLYERINRVIAPSGPPPLPGGPPRCPRCASPVEAGAAFCARCGQPVARYVTPPPPRVQPPRSSPWLVYVIFGLIGLIGLAAYAYWSHDTGPEPRRSFPNSHRPTPPSSW